MDLEDWEYWLEMRRWQARAQETCRLGPLFDQPREEVAAAPLHRRPDDASSVEAAETVAPRLSALQRVVLDELRAAGPTTARDFERRPAFADLGASTVRKRLTELRRAGRVRAAGRARPRSGGPLATVYEVV